jgi:hypothetical protein
MDPLVRRFKGEGFPLLSPDDRLSRIYVERKKFFVEQKICFTFPLDIVSLLGVGAVMKRAEFLERYWFVSLLVLFSGCNTTESTLGGAAIGTALGLGVGHAVRGKKGAAAGAVIGGLGGAAIGHHAGD